MWSTQVFVLDDDGGEVITVTTAGEKPNVKVGQPVSLSKLEALPWRPTGATAWVACGRDQGGRSGFGQASVTGIPVRMISWVSLLVPDAYASKRQSPGRGEPGRLFAPDRGRRTA